MHTAATLRASSYLAALLALLLPSALACGTDSSGGGGDGGAGDDAGQDSGVNEGDASTSDAGAHAGEDAGDAGPSPQDDGGTPPDDAGSTTCTAGESEPCYTGPDDTEGVGACEAGSRTCKADGSGFGACEDEVLPSAPGCSSGDLDCNGEQDGEQDLDDDGFTLCDDDCCDAPDQACGEPSLVNPGAYDFDGDDVDDDCSGDADDAASSCDDSLASDTSSALDHALALGLCEQAVDDPPSPADAHWGVIAATFTHANGSGAPLAAQRALRATFGAIDAQQGERMVVLSTGSAAAIGQTNPSYVAFEPGQDHATTSVMPSDWLAANGGTVPQLSDCPPIAVTNVYDPVMLTLDVRVPTNARAFSLRAYVLSAEYPEWVCSAFNDQFVALLTTDYAGEPANPADGNLAVYLPPAGEARGLGANLAYGDTGLFTQCQNGPIGCSGSDASTATACTSTAELAGTGFDVAAAGCEAGDIVGGGTGWLQLTGNVEPGEVMRLRLAIWDTGDATIDSVVLLDDFRWHAEEQDVGATF